MPELIGELDLSTVDPLKLRLELAERDDPETIVVTGGGDGRSLRPHGRPGARLWGFGHARGFKRRVRPECVRAGRLFGQRALDYLINTCR